MVEYIGESRIDGYPIIKLYRYEEDSKEHNIESRLFIEYFRGLKNIHDESIEVKLVSQLEDKENFLYVKVTLMLDKFKEELKNFERKIRKQKLIQINEIEINDIDKLN